MITDGLGLFRRPEELHVYTLKWAEVEMENLDCEDGSMDV